MKPLVALPVHATIALLAIAFELLGGVREFAALQRSRLRDLLRG